MQIKKSKNFIEYIGHFDDNVLCAKLTLLADLYAIEHKVGYAKFDIKDEDKLSLVNDKLDYKVDAPTPGPSPEPKLITILDNDGSYLLSEGTTDPLIFVSITEHRIEIGDNQNDPVFAVYNDKSILGLATESNGSIAYPVDNMYGFTETTNLYVVWDTSDDITDLTGTTWVFNETINISPLEVGDYEFNINYYLTDDSEVSDIRLDLYSDIDYFEMSYPSISSAYNTDVGGWQNDNFKSITITGGADATNSVLITWLQANAAQQVEPTETKNIWIGANQIAKAFLGSSKVSKIYLGDILVYEKSKEPIPPIISFYDTYNALKIESQDNYEDEYEIYSEGTLIGTYSKFYSFESESSHTITRCLGKQYYTGEIIVPNILDGDNITALTSELFSDTVASKITISEGITLVPVDVFTPSTSTLNIYLPSTLTSLQCLNSYPQTTVNIGLEGYIEYGWDVTMPTPSSNKLYEKSSVHTTTNFYIKDTITTFNNYSLYIVLNATGTINYYFNQSVNEQITFGTNLLYIGTNKIKATYNIYTDNASIKDAMLTYAGSNCTVNVYKRNGGAW